MSKSYSFYVENPVEVVPGALWLYRRSDHEARNWQYRVKFEGRDIVRSTRTPELLKAMETAKDIYTTIRDEGVASMQAMTSNVTWDEVWEAFEEDVLDKKLARGEIGKSRYNGQKSVYRNCIEPYFAGKPAECPSAGTMKDYWKWRMRNSTIINDTLIEQSKTLSSLFRYAKNKGYIRGELPKISPDVKKNKNRRGAYTRKQVETEIFPRLEVWVSEAARPGDVFPRKVFENFVKVSIFSGIRFGTLLNLKWSNVVFPSVTRSERAGYLTVVEKGYAKEMKTKLSPEEYIARNPELKIAQIRIPKGVGKNKGKYLDVIPMHQCTEVLRTWHAKTLFPGDDDFLFPNKTGGKRGSDTIRKFHKGVIGKDGLGLVKDAYGLDLTTYSWRHTYATWQLLFNPKVNQEKLARNMDTSVQNIVDHYGHVYNVDVAEDLAGI
ncbi:MAG: hypothetical protein WD075_01610 [Rhodospirillales bacterium]